MRLDLTLFRAPRDWLQQPKAWLDSPIGFIASQLPGWRDRTDCTVVEDETHRRRNFAPISPAAVPVEKAERLRLTTL